MQKRLALLAAIALAVGAGAPAPAQAKSDRSRVAQRALKQSVRVEVQVGGKVARAASGVVIASDKGGSYVLTNAHVVQREGLAGAPLFVVVIERPRLHRVAARIVHEGKMPDQDLAILSIEEQLPPVPLATEEDVNVGDDVVVIGAPY
ncbi:MAG TPA: serine protease, partial [Myxococcales bacterium]|nr:serine protease [Myxococcales bacterium]